MQLEARNGELESKFSTLTTSHLDLQRVERELRDRLTTSVDKEEHREACDRANREKQAREEAVLEADRLREVADVARNQVSMTFNNISI